MRGLLRSLLRRIFFWRNAEVVASVVSRAVRDGYTELSDKENQAAKDWLEEYVRRADQRRQHR